MGSTRKSFFSNFDEPRFKPKPKTNTFTAEFHVTRMYFQVHVLLNPYKESDLFSFFGFNVNLLILLCSNWATASIIKTQNFYRFLKEFFVFLCFCFYLVIFVRKFWSLQWGLWEREIREREREAEENRGRWRTLSRITVFTLRAMKKKWKLKRNSIKLKKTTMETLRIRRILRLITSNKSNPVLTIPLGLKVTGF